MLLTGCCGQHGAALNLQRRDTPCAATIFSSYSVELRKLARAHETELQRLALKFLVERHVAAVGTTFGRSQTDLRVDDAVGTIVIEAKKLLRTPSEADVNGWLAQLGSYMDQAPVRNSGVLLLFNFTDTTLVVDGVRFGARLHIVAVNLCPTSPSKREDRIDLLPSSGENSERLVAFRRPLDVSLTSRRRRRRPRRARGGRGPRKR
jgi:hypothetical protein